MSTPRTHVALIHRDYAEAILTGRKRVESRLSRMRCEPFGRVAPGDRVFFKETGGPFRACARIARVETRAGLSPKCVRDLRREYGRLIGAGGDYWSAKRDARYATLIWLEGVRPVSDGPEYRRIPRRAWFVLERAA